MLITISGVPGSGKTTVAKLLSKRLGLPHVYAGDIYRQEAQERGISLAELNDLAEADHNIDRSLDERMAVYARQGGVILEGRLAGYTAIQEQAAALKVWLSASEEVRAQRVAHREGQDPHEVLAQNEARHRSDASRYKQIYGFDLYDTSIYDLHLDSDDSSPEELAEQLFRAVAGRFPKEVPAASL